MKALILAASLLGATPALAQTPAAPAAVQPIDPARLALAEKSVAVLVPQGVYMRLMRQQFPAMMDAMLANMETAVPGGRAKARAADPAFDERMRIMTRVMGEELGPLMGRMEPSLRTGMARALAKRFDARQLNDLNAFFATPSGQAFGEQFISLFADPEIMGEMMKAMPMMLQEMPGIMKKVEAATAHLPKPPKPKGENE
ncbi:MULTISPECIES: DUF2059 domain-containing protein [Sphingomonas]|jgi:hypothetical protein|uniref:DUF2059 domain-containing protein n=1 Tax=Sphingomonas hankookensis TaxID=563996 RepID=A0ABR5YAD6_9SPHN|nr:MULTISPECIES: DUF2059 domain-containing protein [Sphingomonas]KZE11147.1 hypothetical protein AVT10_17340 [Sphingomonas hankookensis]PZT90718.1 MAG: DUF2059 domain-containing protein [Sphingomonas sp.]RSV24218.1 DUF2059 domain-containing protein [Sphingomonas sp. ABOLH]WCP72581.1 DUF2059 domain-containing protein [Sphingomonas hankookensis]